MLQRPGPPLDFSSLNINVPAVPIPGITSGREAQYARRVKELEDELRLMKVENEKNVSPELALPLCTVLKPDWSLTEINDCKVPGTLGKAERFGQAEKGGKSGRRCHDWGSGTDRRGTRSGRRA
jgi:hypothetical protein